MQMLSLMLLMSSPMSSCEGCDVYIDLLALSHSWPVITVHRAADSVWSLCGGVAHHMLHFQILALDPLILNVSGDGMLQSVQR